MIQTPIVIYFIIFGLFSFFHYCQPDALMIRHERSRVRHSSEKDHIRWGLQAFDNLTLDYDFDSYEQNDTEIGNLTYVGNLTDMPSQIEFGKFLDYGSNFFAKVASHSNRKQQQQHTSENNNDKRFEKDPILSASLMSLQKPVNLTRENNSVGQVNGTNSFTSISTGSSPSGRSNISGILLNGKKKLGKKAIMANIRKTVDKGVEYLKSHANLSDVDIKGLNILQKLTNISTNSINRNNNGNNNQHDKNPTISTTDDPLLFRESDKIPKVFETINQNNNNRDSEMTSKIDKAFLTTSFDRNLNPVIASLSPTSFVINDKNLLKNDDEKSEKLDSVVLSSQLSSSSSSSSSSSKQSELSLSLSMEDSSSLSLNPASLSFSSLLLPSSSSSSHSSPALESSSRYENSEVDNKDEMKTKTSYNFTSHDDQNNRTNVVDALKHNDNDRVEANLSDENENNENNENKNLHHSKTTDDSTHNYEHNQQRQKHHQRYDNDISTHIIPTNINDSDNVDSTFNINRNDKSDIKDSSNEKNINFFSKIILQPKIDTNQHQNFKNRHKNQDEIMVGRNNGNEKKNLTFKNEYGNHNDEHSNQLDDIVVKNQFHPQKHPKYQENVLPIQTHATKIENNHHQPLSSHQPLQHEYQHQQQNHHQQQHKINHQSHKEFKQYKPQQLYHKNHHHENEFMLHDEPVFEENVESHRAISSEHNRYDEKINITPNNDEHFKRKPGSRVESDNEETIKFSSGILNAPSLKQSNTFFTSFPSSSSQDNAEKDSHTTRNTSFVADEVADEKKRSEKTLSSLKIIGNNNEKNINDSSLTYKNQSNTSFNNDKDDDVKNKSIDEIDKSVIFESNGKKVVTKLTNPSGSLLYDEDAAASSNIDNFEISNINVDDSINGNHDSSNSRHSVHNNNNDTQSQSIIFDESDYSDDLINDDSSSSASTVANNNRNGLDDKDWSDESLNAGSNEWSENNDRKHIDYPLINSDYDDADLDETSRTNRLNLVKGQDVVTRFLQIVETQHLLGANCTAGTDLNLGEGVVDRYAQDRFRVEAEVAVNRANMLTR